jgi:hypothetical protein
MEIFNSAGKALEKSEVLLLTKSISSLVVSSSVPVDTMDDEQISIEVERLSGNLEITKGNMSLKDFILLTTFNGDAVTSDEVYETTAECEICENGAIHLDEKDVIKIRLSGLNPAETYVLNGIEAPDTSLSVLSLENKSMASDEKSKVFDVYDCDIVLLDSHSSIEEIAYTYINDVVVKYTLHELKVLSRSIDPVGYVRKNGTVKASFVGKLQLPLFGVKSIEIRKTQGTIINMVVRKEA